MSKARHGAILVTAAILVATCSGCGSEPSATARGIDRIGALCRQRLGHSSSGPASVASDVTDMNGGIRLNERLIAAVRQLSLPPRLRTDVDSRFLPVIQRLDANVEARIRAVQGRDYKRAYFLGLADNGFADQIAATARRLRLTGCY